MATITERKIRKNPNIAVFSRNHRGFLGRAVEVSSKHPERLITFRAATSWKSVRTALKYYDSLPVYFAPIGGKGDVEYQATLHSVLLDPRTGQQEAKNLLAFCLDATSEEGLWDEEVNTLYVIRQCCKLTAPFPMTSLVKFSDDKPISERYGYSYSIVYEYAGAPEVDIEILPDEVPHAERYVEGATIKISVNAYERSRTARRKCIEHYGLDCAVCGMNFGREYGEIGEGFIHVHHLKSLERIDGKYEVDPINDLRLVCPNCHSMLHKNDPPYSVEELRDISSRRGRR